jgi:DNA-binding response OmpR family regulator
MKAQLMTRLLLVDDEPDLREVVAEYLGRHGFAVDAATDAAHARALVSEQPAALALLDIHMPGEDGLSLARWLRDRHPDTGIVMLSTAAETVDRVVGLEIGADDYLPKPFELRELLARLKSLSRRLAHSATRMPQADTAPPSTRRVRFGTRVLDLNERRLIGPDGADIPVTAAEIDLLALFARAPNRPLNRDQIMEQAHNRGWDVYDRSIDLRIMRLRRKIENNPDKPEVLKTVRGVGYVFAPGSVS